MSRGRLPPPPTTTTSRPGDLPIRPVRCVKSPYLTRVALYSLLIGKLIAQTHGGTRAEATRASHPPTPCIRAHWLACRQVTREQELSIFSSDGSDRAGLPERRTWALQQPLRPRKPLRARPMRRRRNRHSHRLRIAIAAVRRPTVRLPRWPPRRRQSCRFSALTDGNDRAPGQTTDLGITRSTVEDEPISVATLWLVGKPFPLSSLVMINNLYVSVRKRSRPRFGYESGQLSLSA